MISKNAKNIEKSPLTGNVIIAWLDPAHKYHKGAVRNNKIKKGSNGIVQSGSVIPAMF